MICSIKTLVSGRRCEIICTFVGLYPWNTNVLDHEAAIAIVQEWLGHANISITKLG